MLLSTREREKERERESLTKFELISKLSFNESSLTELQSGKKTNRQKLSWRWWWCGGGLNVYKCLVYIIMSSMWQYHASSVKYERMALQQRLAGSAKISGTLQLVTNNCVMFVSRNHIHSAHVMTKWNEKTTWILRRTKHLLTSSSFILVHRSALQRFL